MLILLPPSEGKWAPARGKPLDLESLSFPELADTRRRVLDALVDLCRRDLDGAMSTLGLSPGLAAEVPRNAELEAAPTAAAGRVYTGVLYEALGLSTLSAAAKRRASSRVLVASALFGLVRPTDRIPAYRLSGDVTLPGLGTVAGQWRAALPAVLGPAAGRGLVVDLRSGTYAAFWRPSGAEARRVATARVLHEVGGRRSVVSHFNKATKGRLVRALLEDGSTPRSPADLADVLRGLGWTVEQTDATSLDIVVTEV